jgi:hypothetical protein
VILVLEEGMFLKAPALPSFSKYNLEKKIKLSSW